MTTYAEETWVAPPREEPGEAAASPHFLLPVRTGAAVSGKPSFSIAAAAAQITRGNASWSTGLGQPAAALSYAFAATGPVGEVDGVGGWSRFSADQIKAAELAFLSWSDVANLTFQRVGSGTTGEGAYSNQATIVLNNFSTGQNAEDSAGFALFPGSRAFTSEDGDVWINARETYNTSATGLSVGGYGLFTMVHEIGHALGLDHPGDYNAGTGQPTYATSAIYNEDSKQYSLMSYFDAAVTGADFGTADPSSPLLDDIAAAQRLYGANMTTRTGDTVYGFNSNADRPWFVATTATQSLIFSVWDAGGSDTLDFSGFAVDQMIDLRAGAFSNVGGLKANVSIASGVVIENAIGGAGADILMGNAANNRLTGGGGADTLDGGDGVDTAVYTGARASYTVTRNADGSMTVTDTRAGAPDGTDRLVSIEQLQFSDGLINPAAPTLSAPVNTAVLAVTRADSAAVANTALANQLNGLQIDAALPLILQAARQTSTVATLSYEFFTGKAPTAAGMDFLVSPNGPNANNLNSAYYQSFNIENRYINFAVNLGKLGEGAGAFQATYGAKTLFDATRDAYRTIFGTTPTDQKLHDILDPTLSAGGQSLTRAQYFALYGGDGANGIGTKAAMVGFLLTEAVKADVGIYARSNDLYLADVGQNNAPFGVDLVGKYARPDFAFG